MVTMEELLASQSFTSLKLERGQEVEGEVESIGDKEIILDLGTKSEGILQNRDIAKNQLETLKVGDKIKAYVSIVENESGQVVLSLQKQAPVRHSEGGGRGFHPRGRAIDWNKFIQAQNQKNRLQGTVMEVNKGGLIVEVDGTRGFLPNSQVGFELISKSGDGMENLIGKTLNLTVIEVDSSNNKLIFTQRGQVSEEIKKRLKEFKTNQKSEGKIVAILPFGLIVDVAGVEGLVFISDASWEKIEDLSKNFALGQSIAVMIIGIDEDLGRLNLSIKQLAEDPFAKLAEKYLADEVVKGEITEVSEAGVAVKLNGVEGFLPASKMSPDGIYEVGKAITVLVDSVDSKKRRINLAPFVTSTEGLIYK